MSLDAAFTRVFDRLGDLDAVIDRLSATEVSRSGLVAVRRLGLGANLSTSSNSVFVEMSTSYRITHAQASASNFLILVAVMSITLSAGEGATFTFFRDGVSVGVGYGNFAAVGSDNRVVAATFSQGDTSSHTWSPGWAAAGAYQIDHFGGGVANGAFILLEVQAI